VNTDAQCASGVKNPAIRIITSISTVQAVQLKDLVDGTIVGYGSDYIVVQKGKKRLLVECVGFKVQELKSHGTPYGSQFD
jgi:hypothetical protein